MPSQAADATGDALTTVDGSASEPTSKQGAGNKRALSNNNRSRGGRGRLYGDDDFCGRLFRRFGDDDDGLRRFFGDGDDYGFYRCAFLAFPTPLLCFARDTV